MFLLETVNLKSISTGLEGTLRSGNFVTFIVKKKLSDGLYRISLMGKTLSVRSAHQLKINSPIRAQVLWRNNTLQLKVVDPVSRQPLVTGQQNESGIAKLVTEALLRSMMPVSSRNMDTISRAVRRRGLHDEKIIRMMALMTDRGIPLSDENINEMNNLLFSYGNREDKPGEKEGKDRSNSKQFIDNEALKKKINRYGQGKELLKYFNHRRSSRDNWIIIPIDYKFKKRGKGILKLRFNEKMEFTDFVFTLGSDMSDWEFRLKADESAKNMKINGPGNLNLKEVESFRKLREKLYKIGIQTDDINNEPPSVDSFGGGKTNGYESIDFMV